MPIGCISVSRVSSRRAGPAGSRLDAPDRPGLAGPGRVSSRRAGPAGSRLDAPDRPGLAGPGRVSSRRAGPAGSRLDAPDRPGLAGPGRANAATSCLATLSEYASTWHTRVGLPEPRPIKHRHTAVERKDRAVGLAITARGDRARTGTLCAADAGACRPMPAPMPADAGRCRPMPVGDQRGENHSADGLHELWSQRSTGRPVLPNLWVPVRASVLGLRREPGPGRSILCPVRHAGSSWLGASVGDVADVSDRPGHRPEHLGTPARDGPVRRSGGLHGPRRRT